MKYHNRLTAILLISGAISGQQYAASRANGVMAPVYKMPVVPTTTKAIITTEPTTPQTPRQTEDEKKKAAIIAHVAQIVNSLSMIAVDPKNRPNVSMQVGNVLGNVIGIAMTAGQRNGTPMDMQTAEQYLNAMDEQTKMKIAALVSTEMLRSMRDKGSKA